MACSKSTCCNPVGIGKLGEEEEGWTCGCDAYLKCCPQACDVYRYMYISMCSVCVLLAGVRTSHHWQVCVVVTYLSICLVWLCSLFLEWRHIRDNMGYRHCMMLIMLPFSQCLYLGGL